MATQASNQVEIVVEAHDTAGGKKVVNNTHWWKPISGAPAASKLDLVTAFRTLWRALAVPMFTTAYVVDRYRIRNIDDPLDSYLDLAGTAGDIGGETPPTIPTMESVVLQLRSGVRGRSYNGSLHLWGFGDSSVENNQLTAGALATLQTWRNTFLAGLTVGSEFWYSAVWSRKLSPTPPATDNQFMVGVIAAPINVTVGVMRHRKVATITG